MTDIMLADLAGEMADAHGDTFHEALSIVVALAVQVKSIHPPFTFTAPMYDKITRDQASGIMETYERGRKASRR